MAEKIAFIPNELPILPVRDTVLFPGAVMPLTVGRESSLALLESLDGEKLLGVVAQLDPRIEDPQGHGPAHRRHLGKVHKMVRMPNGNTVAFLEGIERLRVVEILGVKPFLRAKIERQPDVEAEVDADLTALVRNAQEVFREVVARSPQLSDDLQTVVLNIEPAGRLADFIAGTLPSLSTMLRQELLETFSVRKRLEALSRELSKEREVLELRNKIQEQVQEQVNQSQREFLLREQMKAIQKELGDGDDGQAEIDELRKKVEESGMPAEAKKECDRELKRLARMTPASAEYMVARTYLEWMTSLPWNKILRHRRHRHRQRRSDPGRGSLRPQEGEAAHSGLSGGEETAAGNEGAHPVLRRASWSGQDVAGEIDCPSAGTQIRAHLPRGYAR